MIVAISTCGNRTLFITVATIKDNTQKLSELRREAQVRGRSIALDASESVDASRPLCGRRQTTSGLLSSARRRAWSVVMQSNPLSEAQSGCFGSHYAVFYPRGNAMQAEDSWIMRAYDMRRNQAKLRNVAPKPVLAVLENRDVKTEDCCCGNWVLQ